MLVNDVMVKIRLYASDTAKQQLSDWQIINSINDALRVMAEESSRMGGSLFRAHAELTMTPSGVVLPTGYLRVIKAFGSTKDELFNVHTDTPDEYEFSINGNKVYSGLPSVPAVPPVDTKNHNVVLRIPHGGYKTRR